jgi:hypothetical protein
MRLDNVTRNIRVLWRADAIIAQAQMQQILARLGLQAFAALVFLFGLFCFELAAYFWLVQRWDAIAAAAILGAINFLLALAVTLTSRLVRPGRDVHLATELHRSAIEALQADAVAVQGEIESLKSAFVRPLDSALAAVIVPAASLLVRALKRTKTGE